ncbi:uncharacterized protein LOC130532542 isoform X1 [Takifugu flavidus]|uniref:uncharacterized protein LOC130532542 isoform X1 n=1 Tax=Takifugu flavidus TaxID=433684 RepID=UPI002544AC83|nr:uncharacterized protein LOC130532542 isoform X1 [Takifugu flavidus]XP_056901223.1 uncharacterized protein LOC130532542 isoform X1 [Takifugu flavidus]
MSLKFRSLSSCVIFKPSQVIQIMVASFYLGLGPRQIFNFPVDSTDMGATFWLGVVVNYTSQYLFYETHLSLWHHYFFTLYLMLLIVMWFYAFLSLQYLTAGVLVVVAGLSLSVWLMRVAVSVNLIALIVTIACIVLYGIDLGAVSVVWMCHSYREDKNNCLKVVSIAQSLLTATYITITVLAGLQLCVCITLVVLGIKMFNGTKQGDKSAPLLPTEDLS